MHKSAFLIAGPTASGKSALALALAQAFGGAVINADSMQIYRDLRIITARPTPEEENRAPHFLFGTVDGAVNYSVGRWLDDISATLAKLSPELTPIIVGGTGLYFKAALQGLSDMPAVPPEARDRVRAHARGKTPQSLHDELMARDPLTAARLRPTDPQRILRALEILEATGRPLASFHDARSKPLLDATRTRCFFIAPERAELYARIDRRFDFMMAAGALEEVRTLHARALDPALPVMRAHGVPHLVAYLEGRLGLDEAITRGKLDTRHYAKRQFTFARHQLRGFHWLTSADPLAELRAVLTPPA